MKGSRVFHAAVDSVPPQYPYGDLMDGVEEWLRSRRSGAGRSVPARRRGGGASGRS